MGGDSDYKFFFIELHYDNPKEDLGFIDKVTFNFYATKTLQKNELGVLTIGKDAFEVAIGERENLTKLFL